jgi:hypothetical protein
MADSPQAAGWVRKGFALLLIIFCMELGVFLLFYPWTEQWTQSVFPTYITGLRSVWLNGYFRGAVSGFGVLDLWIALGEIFRLRRFSPPQANDPM